MKFRKGKASDQDNVEKAFILLLDLIENNQKEIEPTLWVGAMICALAQSFKDGDIPFEQFKKEMNLAIEHYKY